MKRLRAILCRMLHGPDDVQFAGFGSTYTCRRCRCIFPVSWAKETAR